MSSKEQTMDKTLADKLNEALAAGMTVTAQVYNGATHFGPKWAGRFSMGKDGHVYVTRGKSSVCYLTGGTRWGASK